MMFSFSISARMWISFSMSPMATPLLEVSTLFFLMYLTIPIIPSTHIAASTLKQLTVCMVMITIPTDITVKV